MVEEISILKIKELWRKAYERVSEYAKKSGFKLNPDKKIVALLIRGMVINKLKYGEFYCPCRRVTGDPEKDRLIICPCAYHKEEIERFGKCHCGLFVKGDNSL